MHTNIIPPDAIEEIKEHWINRRKKSADYSLDGEKVGYRYWEENGQLCMEYGIKDGKMHGLYRVWHENGNLNEESFYLEGKEHGLTKQYDWDGNLIGTYQMHHGTGVDLWYMEKGKLSEERYYKDGNLDGYERWWNEDNQTIWSEKHFKVNEEHGIYREWNSRGALRRGFPQYYINGKKVTKKPYLKACEKDETLPKFIEVENKPWRELPAF